MNRFLVRRILTAIAFACIINGSAHAGPVVPGFERFGQKDGSLLLAELNCVLCHKGETSTIPQKQGPTLDKVGQRVRVSYLRKFLADPHSVKPGTTMPSLFAGDPDKDAKVESLVQFLASTGTPQQERPDNKSANAGKDLYHKIGCVACHGSRTAKGAADKTTPANVPLVDLASKYTIPSLAAFLENPHQARPSGRMPMLLVDGKDRAKEARELANFLLPGVKANLPIGKGTTKFAYYEGAYEKLPNFAKLKPNDTGTSSAFSLTAAKQRSNYAMTFEGVFKIEKEGQYKFWLASDDGSKLYIDGDMIVNNDGIHPVQLVTNSARLAKGIHKVKIEFFQAGGGDELEIDIDGSGLSRQPLGGLVAADEDALAKVLAPEVRQDDVDFIDIQAEQVAKGKALFASAGCVNCHQIKGIKATLTPLPLAKLKSGGCVSEAPVKGLPFFGLNEAQRKALDATIANPVVVDKAPASVIARTMVTFNCYACHSRDKIGGPEDDLNKLFLTTQQEMGDEARVPPPLDNVGAKMKPDYLKSILDKGSHDRPYMLTRMPGFGIANVGPVHAALLDADKGKFAAAPTVAFAEAPGKIKSTARHMVGGQAFGCIKCHTFAGNKAEGVQGMDMTLLTQRLNRDWFHSYLQDPQKIRPGTRMPSAFDKGKSLLPKILDGTATTQIEAMWVYLGDGKKAQLPFGVKKQFNPLTPVKDAIIYRNFIEGAGSRAIGVGYPEKVNLAFDANEMRLAMIWHGAFIEASRHWTGRGEGYEPPLGDNVAHLPTGATFASLAKPEEAWPTTTPKSQGYKFGGYALASDERPTFFYSVGSARIEDAPNALVVGKEVGLTRTFTISGAGGGDGGKLHLRAAVGKTITAQGDGVFLIDGSLRIKLTGAGPAVVRSSAGKMELIAPIAVRDGKATVTMEYHW